MLIFMALAWVPLTSHCQIEALSGIESLRCPAGDEAPVDEGDPCRDAGCCSFDSSKYVPGSKHDLKPIVFLASPLELLDSIPLRSLPEEVCLGILTAAPPEIHSSWQFDSRAALPVRAPSLAS